MQEEEKKYQPPQLGDGIPAFASEVGSTGVKDDKPKEQAAQESAKTPVPNPYFEEEPPLTKEEEEADNLVALMSQIKEMTERNQQKDGDGNTKVSDEDRRKNAELMMKKLSSMMDLDSDDEEDDGDQ